jgi:uncharacterized protein (TIGR03435 family)
LEYKKDANGKEVATISRCGLNYVGGQGQFGAQVLVVFASRVTMIDFASMLTRVLDRSVTDRTGLAGEFDFVVRASEVLSAAPSPSADAPAGNQKLFVAVEEQLGLKLQSTRATVDVLRILQVQPPTEN